METYYGNFELVKENNRLAREKAQKFALIKLAEQGKNGRSKMLVKLAGLLIDTGLRLKMYAERDLRETFQVPTLQDL